MLRLLRIYIKFILKRVLFVTFWLSLLSLFYFLHPNPYLYINLNAYIQLDYAKASLPFWLYVIHVLIVIFLLLIVVETLYVLFYNWIKHVAVRQKERILKRMQTELFAFLTGEINDINPAKVFGTFSGFFCSEQKVLFFVEGLREVELLTKGIVHERCLSVFVVLRIKKLIWSYMYSPYGKHRLFAMRTIGDFHLKDYEPYLKKYLNHSNPIYRSAALEAYLQLSTKNDLSFLKELRAALSQWDYNMVLKHGKNLEAINYTALLQSKTPELVMLALDFIRHNNEYGYKSQVISLLNSSNVELKEKAYITYSLFLDDESEVKELTYRYYSFSLSTRGAILDLLINIRYSSTISFFLNWLVQSGSLNEKVTALTVFLYNDVASLLKYQHSSDPQIRLAFAQVSDINYFN